MHSTFISFLNYNKISGQKRNIHFINFPKLSHLYFDVKIICFNTFEKRKDKCGKILGKNLYWTIFSVITNFCWVICSMNIVISTIDLIKYSEEKLLNNLFNEKWQNSLNNAFTEQYSALKFFFKDAENYFNTLFS